MTDERNGTPDVTERFRQHVADSAELLAHDLAALLNRASKLGVAVVPDFEDGYSTGYSIEWCFSSKMGHLDVEWDNVSGWSVTGKDPRDIAASAAALYRRYTEKATGA